MGKKKTMQISDSHLKRISLMIRENQYDKVNEEKLNLSGLVRNMLDDHFSGNKIVLHTSSATRTLYDKVMSNTGSSDTELEPYLQRAFQEFLKDKVKAIRELEEEVARDIKKGF